jgi:hypothetical protein
MPGMHSALILAVHTIYSRVRTAGCYMLLAVKTYNIA